MPRAMTRRSHGHPRPMMPLRACRRLLAALGMRITLRGPLPASRLRAWAREAIAIRVHVYAPTRNRYVPDVPAWELIPGVDDGPAWTETLNRRSP
jgi:hypothetical protein